VSALGPRAWWVVCCKWRLQGSSVGSCVHHRSQINTNASEPRRSGQTRGELLHHQPGMRRVITHNPCPRACTLTALPCPVPRSSRLRGRGASAWQPLPGHAIELVAFGADERCGHDGGLPRTRTKLTPDFRYQLANMRAAVRWARGGAVRRVGGGAVVRRRCGVGLRPACGPLRVLTCGSLRPAGSQRFAKRTFAPSRPVVVPGDHGGCCTTRILVWAVQHPP